MGWIEIVLGVYALIAATALTLTLREQLRLGSRGLLFAFGGYVACTLWPLAFAAVLIEAQRHGV